MKYAALIAKVLVFTYLGYLVVFFMLTDGPATPGYHPPFILWLLDTMNLFIHEAGHFFIRPFGMWIYIFGGSFVQCFLPLTLAVVTWRQSPEQVSFPAFWFGENLINVSYYIKDAPDKHLRLLAAGLIHDWNWLLSDNLDSAEWMVNDGIPRQLLQQAVQFVFLLQVVHLRQIARQWQAHRAAPIDHRIVAVAVQHLQRRLRMAPVVAEEIPLGRQPRRRSGDDPFPQGIGGLPYRHDERHVLA